MTCLLINKMKIKKASYGSLVKFIENKGSTDYSYNKLL